MLCDIAGITSAAYYKWLNHSPSLQEIENEEIIKEIKVINENIEGIYGYRRMKLNINRKFDKNFNHKRIYRLMKINMRHLKNFQKQLMNTYTSTIMKDIKKD